MEKLLEKKFRLKANKKGMLFLKWTSPGFSGVPDRILLCPGGKMFLLEFKNGSRGVISPRQKVVFQQMNDLGITVHIIASVEDMEEFFFAQC